MVALPDHPDADGERSLDELEPGDHVLVDGPGTVRRAIFLERGPFDCPRGREKRFCEQHVKLHEIGTDQRTVAHEGYVVPAKEIPEEPTT